jgi:hypothetical protein
MVAAEAEVAGEKIRMLPVDAAAAVVKFEEARGAAPRGVPVPVLEPLTVRRFTTTGSFSAALLLAVNNAAGA